MGARGIDSVERVFGGGDRYAVLLPSLVFVLALVARLGFFAYLGPYISPDTYAFLDACHLWFSDPLEAVGFIKGIEYAGFTLPLCGVLTLTGSATAWVLLQLVLSSATCVVVYRIGVTVLDRTTGFVAGVGLALLWDTFRWSAFVLSETTFTFVVAVALWAYSRHHVEPSPSSKLFVWASLVLLALTRPFGVPIAAAWLAWDLLPQRVRIRPALFNRPLVAAVLLVLVGVVVGFGGASHLSVDALTSRLLPLWRDGIVYAGPRTPNYQYTPNPSSGFLGFVVANWYHLLVLMVLKVGAFFSPVYPVEYPPVHVLINLLTLVPLFVGGFLGGYRLLRRRAELIPVWLTPLLATLGIVAIYLMSLDLRYRAPTGPVFALLTGYYVSTSAVAGTITTWVERRWRSEEPPK